MPSITVKGMRCENCRKAVQDAVSRLPGLSDLAVDVRKGEVRWTDASPAAPVAVDAVKKAVIAVGFEAP